MKKFIVMFVMMLSFMTSYASSEGLNTGRKMKVFECSEMNHVEWIRKSHNYSKVLNHSYGKNCFDEPELILNFRIGDEDFVFNVFRKVVVDGKTFLIGNGKYGIKCICIDKDTICIPFQKNKELIFKSKKSVSYILEQTSKMYAFSSFEEI